MHFANVVLIGLLQWLAYGQTLPNVRAIFGSSPKPVTIDVDETFMEDVYSRVKNARAPVPIKDLEFKDDDGAPLRDFDAIRDHWLQKYDWKVAQSEINERFHHFTTTVQTPESNYTHTVPLHFVHHRSDREDAIPLLFVHGNLLAGWPGSFLEVLNIIDSLTNPPNTSVPAFHVIAPSVPGFGFSPAPTYAGYGPLEAAHTFNALMLQLGYPKYVLQAGDLGSIISRFQAAYHPENVISLLSNFWLIQPTPEDHERYEKGETTEEETAYMQSIETYKKRYSGYRLVQGTKPLQLAYALTDSPLGFTMWITSLIRTQSDAVAFPPHEIITYALFGYIVQGPYGGFRMYRGMYDENVFDAVEFRSMPYVEVPVAMQLFKGDIWFGLPLDWARREGDVRESYVHDRGGHFAAKEEPLGMVQDCWKWFGRFKGEFGGEGHDEL